MKMYIFKAFSQTEIVKVMEYLVFRSCSFTYIDVDLQISVRLSETEVAKLDRFLIESKIRIDIVRSYQIA